MVAPKHRKVRLKRALDATVFRGVMPGATALVAASAVEAREYRAAGIPRSASSCGRTDFRTCLGDVAPREAAPAHRHRRRDARRAQRGQDRARERARAARSARDAAPRRAPRRSSAPTAATASTGSCSRCAIGSASPTACTSSARCRDPSWPDVYADADVFVLPSRYENFGMVAAEAAAAGAPIVVTDRCGVAECFADRGALVVPYGEQRAPDRTVAAARRRRPAAATRRTRRARSRPSGRGRACSTLQEDLTSASLAGA